MASLLQRYVDPARTTVSGNWIEKTSYTPVPFDQWSPDDQNAAFTVARQFELVGVLIEGRLFDPNLFLRSWHHTVAWCWQACVPMVEHQRTQLQQPGFGRFFEELEALARLCKPVVVAERLGYHVVVLEDGTTVVVPNADGGSK